MVQAGVNTDTETGTAAINSSKMLRVGNIKNIPTKLELMILGVWHFPRLSQTEVDTEISWHS